MLCMKWHVFGFFVFMMSAGAVWAGERGYQLAAGTESKLCARVLTRFVRMWTIEGGYGTSTKSFVRSPGSRSN